MTREEAIRILKNRDACSYGDCDIYKNCKLCDHNVTPEEVEEAFKIAIETMQAIEDIEAGYLDIGIKRLFK